MRASTYPITAPGQEGNWNRGAILNHYSQALWGGSDQSNNGNLRAQQVWIPSDDAVSGWTLLEQTYAYDALNRLKRVSEGGRWQQEYSYDRWGNRTVNAAATWNAPAPAYTASPATNRLQPPAGHSMTYDAAGNLTNDSYTGYGSTAGAQTRLYDAESRMTSAQGVGGQASTYKYDADGRRVRRAAAGGGEVWQVYGAGGELLAEYAAGSAATTPQKEYGYRGGELLVTAEPGAPAEGKLSPAAVTASGASGANAPARAADGEQATSWVSGGFPTQWLQYDMGQARDLTRVRLLVSQDPAGPTTHQVWGGPTPSGLALLGTFSGATQSGQWLELEAPAAGVRYVRVVTTQGPSWVAWREVEVYGRASGGAADLRWLVTDHLGTPRMVIDRAGSLAGVRRHDYLPFGEEVGAGVGGRTTAQGYSTYDGVRQQYVGKERDSETGLDFFAARYYSNPQGRFTGVDPYNPVTDSEDAEDFLSYLQQPQHWNRYVYTANNPLNRHDPDGRRWFYKCEKGSGCDVQWVNPNEDGSYTSPGEGWMEHNPNDGHLRLLSADGRVAYYFGEGKDGSPIAFSLWTGKVEDASMDLVMTLSGGLGVKALAKGALGLWAKHQAKREAFELAVQALSKKNPNQIAKGISDVLRGKNLLVPYRAWSAKRLRGIMRMLPIKALKGRSQRQQGDST